MIEISDEDKFQSWIAEMDDALDDFISMINKETGLQLDFSPDSLSVLESWLLSTYPSTESMLSMQEASIIDGAARYVGEVFRKNLGSGRWLIDFSNPRNAFYGLPQIVKLPGQKVQICPLTLVTASADRRTGKFLASIYEHNKKNAE